MKSPELRGAVPAIVLATAALASPTFESESAYAANPNDAFKDLPGYDIHVSQKTRDAAAAATVKLYNDFDYDNTTPYESSGKGGYMPETALSRLGGASCTGTNVKYAGNTYVSTAAHCYESLTGSESGLLDSKVLPLPAYNFIDQAIKNRQSINIADASEPNLRRQKLATATDLSIGQQSDWALLKMQSTAIDQDLGQPKRNYNSLPTLLLRKKQPTPIPGQEVALNGAPGENLDRMIKTVGRYVGRVTLVTIPGENRKLDIVAINPKRPYTDSCYFGASGSAFTYNVKSKTIVSGPLSLRFNELYDPYLANNADGTSKKDRTKNFVRAVRFYRDIIETQTNTNLKDFSTICAYSADRNNDNSSPLATMVSGFDTDVPVTEATNQSMK